MKRQIIVLAFIILTNFVYGQNDTLDMVPIFTEKPGHYEKYYPSGKLLLEGTYERVDSIECVNCYDPDFNKVYTKAGSTLMRTGKWKSYHQNGQLMSIGIYKGIHETTIMVIPKDYGKKGQPIFIPGGLRLEYVKDKLWNYYDEKGQLIQEEYYYNGVLVSIKNMTSNVQTANKSLLGFAQLIFCFIFTFIPTLSGKRIYLAGNLYLMFQYLTYSSNGSSPTSALRLFTLISSTIG